jgi:hypothetical protein
MTKGLCCKSELLVAWLPKKPRACATVVDLLVTSSYTVPAYAVTPQFFRFISSAKRAL